MRFFFFFLIMHKVHFYPFLNSRKEKKEKNRGKREEKKNEIALLHGLVHFTELGPY